MVPGVTSFISVAALAEPDADALAEALLELALEEQPAKATTIRAAAAIANSFFFITFLLSSRMIDINLIGGTIRYFSYSCNNLLQIYASIYSERHYMQFKLIFIRIYAFMGA